MSELTSKHNMKEILIGAGYFTVLISVASAFGFFPAPGSLNLSNFGALLQLFIIMAIFVAVYHHFKKSSYG